MARTHRRTIQKRSSPSRLSRQYDHSPIARHPGMQSQVGLFLSTLLEVCLFIDLQNNHHLFHWLFFCFHLINFCSYLSCFLLSACFRFVVPSFFISRGESLDYWFESILFSNLSFKKHVLEVWGLLPVFSTCSVGTVMGEGGSRGRGYIHI